MIGIGKDIIEADRRLEGFVSNEIKLIEKYKGNRTNLPKIEDIYNGCLVLRKSWH